MFSIAVFVLLAAGTIGPFAVWVALARVGRGVLGVGIALAIGINLLAVFGWMLSGMSEYPDNSVGHPDRVHVTNASGSPAVLVLAEPTTDVLSGYSLRRLPDDEPTVLSGSFHAAAVGDVCLDRPAWIIPVGPATAAATGRDVEVEFTADELRSAVRLDDCHRRGDHVLVWDGASTSPDVSWKPPLIHPSHEPLAVGGVLAGVMVAIGSVAQFGLDRRREVSRGRARPHSARDRSGG